MTDLSLGPVRPGVCLYCGCPTGDDGSLCDPCGEEQRRRREPVIDDDGPFLPEDDE